MEGRRPCDRQMKKWEGKYSILGREEERLTKKSTREPQVKEYKI